MRQRIILALALCILSAPGLFLYSGCSSPELPVEAKAAIIDQLNPSEPDPAFVNRATAILQDNGFKVDYYQGDQITVDLYRRLPALGYGIVIFRAHSGLLGTGEKRIQKTCLFTNQLYSRTAEMGDQLSDRLVKARNDEDPPIFGIGADFVGKSMRSGFNRTAIIMMGCSSLENDDLARAFIEKGASVYTGWNASVGLNYVEDVTLALLDNLSDNVSLESAVKAAMQEKGPDSLSGAKLEYYPEKGGAITLAWLLP
jgi:hypothetical protein